MEESPKKKERKATFYDRLLESLPKKFPRTTLIEKAIFVIILIMLIARFISFSLRWF